MLSVVCHIAAAFASNIRQPLRWLGLRWLDLCLGEGGITSFNNALSALARFKYAFLATDVRYLQRIESTFQRINQHLINRPRWCGLEGCAEVVNLCLHGNI